MSPVDFELKCYVSEYAPIVAGEQKAMVRLNDRSYKKGQHIVLREGWDTPEGYHYTGAETLIEVTHVSKYAMIPGNVMVSFEVLTQRSING